MAGAGAGSPPGIHGVRVPRTSTAFRARQTTPYAAKRFPISAASRAFLVSGSAGYASSKSAAFARNLELYDRQEGYVMGSQEKIDSFLGLAIIELQVAIRNSSIMFGRTKDPAMGLLHFYEIFRKHQVRFSFRDEFFGFPDFFVLYCIDPCRSDSAMAL